MAQGVYLYGWDATNEVWRKVLINDEGKLIIDPSEIFENDPTDNEHGKAPDSDWAFEHKADADAHHEEYTDVKAREAINNILDETGKLAANLDCGYRNLEHAARLYLYYSGAATYYGMQYHLANSAKYRHASYKIGVGYVNCDMELFRTDHYVDVIHEDNLLSMYADKKDTQYLSIPGTGFLGQQSFTDNIDYDVSSGKVSLNVDDCRLMASVNLPEGTTVAGVIVYGNAAAEAETFELRRVKLLDATNSQMATQSINTEDITITNPIIDNANYAYFIVTSSLDIGDEIYGALIVYEL